MQILDVALGISGQGFPVFPCGKSKKPAISKAAGGHGFHDAVAETEAVRILFGRANAILVGVPTGERSGFDVLDFDYRHGAAEWEQANTARIPATRQHRTMSGGKHLLFRHAPGVRNLESKFAAGMDVRGEGGYIIMPPSRGYTVENELPLAEWPQWLLEIILSKPTTREMHSYIPVDIASKRLDGFLRSVLDKVRAAGEGQKHYVLRNAALSLGGIQDAASLSDGQITESLLAALPQSVKDWNTARATIAWGLENGRKRPVHLPDRERAPSRQSDPPANTFDGYDPDSPFDSSVQTPIATPRIIRVLAGERHVAADAGIAALVSAKAPFYQRDRALVRAAVARAKSSDGRVIETPGIIPVTNPVLARALGQAARWERPNKDGELIRIDPPKEVVEQIAAMTGEWPFPPLAGVIGTPTMRPDGSLLVQEGYDEATGLFLLAPPVMPTIPERPTWKDAERALTLLAELLTEFPFADETSRSVGMSAILTAVLRGALAPAVPMHVVTAPQPGTGKSYLLDTVAVIATGERCPVIAFAKDPAETEKRLVGAALAGFPIIALDNISDVLTGDFLAQVTERPILQLRPLGGSNLVRVSNTYTMLADGNNLTASADMVRRTLRCALDSDLENPEERQFSGDPVAEVLKDRGRYVAACLTIARGYLAAGRPNPCRRLPSFAAWSDMVRSPLVWLGWPDPVTSMDFARADDPIRQTRAELFTSWANELGLTPSGLLTSELIEATNASYDGQWINPKFRESCLAVAKDRSTATVSSERLGKWLRGAKDTRANGLKLTVNRQDVARPRWTLYRDGDAE